MTIKTRPNGGMVAVYIYIPTYMYAMPVATAVKVILAHNFYNQSLAVLPLFFFAVNWKLVAFFI